MLKMTHKNENISACSTIDTANLGIKVEEIKFPVKHGTEISYSCNTRNHLKKVQKNKAVCRDGIIAFTSGASSSSCSKVGKLLCKYKVSQHFC